MKYDRFDVSEFSCVDSIKRFVGLCKCGLAAVFDDNFLYPSIRYEELPLNFLDIFSASTILKLKSTSVADT